MFNVISPGAVTGILALTVVLLFEYWKKGDPRPKRIIIFLAILGTALAGHIEAQNNEFAKREVEVATQIRDAESRRTNEALQVNIQQNLARTDTIQQQLAQSRQENVDAYSQIRGLNSLLIATQNELIALQARYASLDQSVRENNSQNRRAAQNALTRDRANEQARIAAERRQYCQNSERQRQGSFNPTVRLPPELGNGECYCGHVILDGENRERPSCNTIFVHPPTITTTPSIPQFPPPAPLLNFGIVR